MVLASYDRDGVAGEWYRPQSGRTAVGQGRYDEIQMAGSQRLHEVAVEAPYHLETQSWVSSCQFRNDAGQRAAEP